MPLRLAVPFHGGNRGSNPLGDANLFKGLACGNIHELGPESNRSPKSSPGLGGITLDAVTLDS